MKKLLSTFILFTMIAGFQGTAFANPYSDVDESTWYYDSIIELNSIGSMTGNPDGTFSPDKCVNRAEMVKLVLETLFTEEFEDDPEITLEYLAESFQAVSFEDVTDLTAWYVPYLNIAAGLEIVEGYPDGTFRPADCVNRAEAVKITSEMFAIELPTNQANEIFVDVQGNDWFFKYISAASYQKVLPTKHIEKKNQDSGWLVSYYYPADHMTRKEVAHLVNESFKVFQEIGPKRARDGRRKALVNSFLSAVEAYNLDYGTYPVGIFCTDGDAFASTSEQNLIDILGGTPVSGDPVPNPTVCNGEFIRYESNGDGGYQIFIELEYLSPSAIILDKDYSDSNTTITKFKDSNNGETPIFRISRTFQ